MMQNVQIPDGFVLEGTPQQSAPQAGIQIPPGFILEASPASSAKADQLPLPMSAGETAGDVAKGAMAGIGNGIAGTIGLPSDLYNLSNDQRVKQGNAFVESLSPEQKQLMIESLKQNKSPLIRGANIDEIFQPKAPHQNIPGGSQDIQGFINKNIPGADFEAMSRLGKLAQTGSEFAASTAVGGLPAVGRAALPKLAGAGFTSGVVSEAAGQATEGSAAELPARIAGGIVGGLPVLAAGTKKLAGNANARNMIRERIGKVSDDDFERAAQIQRAAKEQGIDLTGPESFDSAALDQLESATRQSATGGPVIHNAIGNRNQQVNRALKTNFDDIAPDGLDPRQVGAQTNKAANASLKAARDQRSKATDPFYTAAEQDIATPSLVQVLKNDITKIKTSPGHPLNDAVQQFSKMLGGSGNTHVETNIGRLDETYKLWRDKLVIRHDSPPEQKALVARLGPMVKRLGNLIENESTHIAMGRRVHKRITRDIVKPLEQSGMSEIAKSKTLKAATNLLTNPELARPKQVQGLLNELGRQNPALPAKMLRIHLENALDRAGKKLTSKTKNTGATFYKSVYPSDNSKAIMITFFRSIEKQNGVKPGTLFRGFDKTMKVLGRVGRIGGTGSQTQLLQEIKREASRPGFVGKAASAVNILKGGPLAQIKEYSTDFASRRTYEELARLFTNRDSVSLIRQISNSKEVMSPKSLSAIISLLNTGRQSVNSAAKSDQVQ